MKTTEAGQRAEALVGVELAKQGYRIVARNWRNRWCEIDLIAERTGRYYFVEVKYRRQTDFGSGFDYITADKRRRLITAAQVWIAQFAPQAQHQIDVAQVSGELGAPTIEYLPNAVQA